MANDQQPRWTDQRRCHPSQHPAVFARASQPREPPPSRPPIPPPQGGGSDARSTRLGPRLPRGQGRLPGGRQTASAENRHGDTPHRWCPTPRCRLRCQQGSPPAQASAPGRRAPPISASARAACTPGPHSLFAAAAGTVPPDSARPPARPRLPPAPRRAPLPGPQTRGPPRGARTRARMPPPSTRPHAPTPTLGCAGGGDLRRSRAEWRAQRARATRPRAASEFARGAERWLDRHARHGRGVKTR